MRHHCFQTVTIALAGLLSLSAFSPALSAQEPPAAPPTSTEVVSTGGVVAADHPLASELGAQILERGGNAADAAVTTMLALGVVNPFASGLGGGGFCLYRPQETGKTTVLDFREVAPSSAHRDMYVVDGQARPQLTIRGGLAVGVPGEAGGLWALHGRFGALPWNEVVEPAYRIARDGHPAGQMLVRHIQTLADELEQHPEYARLLKRDDGAWIEPGDTLQFPALARALELLMNEGSAPFYNGDVARAIVEAVNASGGEFTLDDLRAYRVIPREPLVGHYRGYELITMPPPSSGGVAILQALNILEGFDLSEMGWTAAALHRIVEAIKHAFADRARWLGDPDFVDIPVERLTSPQYAAELRARIRPDGVLPPEQYGTVRPNDEGGGTAHLSVIDADGNMAACTTTVNTRFGSMVFVEQYGLILNNEMADFTAEPGRPNVFGLVGSEHNAVQPGKRPLSSMSPTLVLRDGEPYASLGASGGPTIITGTLFTLLHMIDFGRTAGEAVSSPRIHHQWIPARLSVERGDLPWLDALRQLGHDIHVRPAFNSVQIVARDRDGRLVGVSDHRKFGLSAAADANATPPPQREPVGDTAP